LDQHSEGVRTIWDVLARVQSSHGTSSLQLELPLAAMGSCMRTVADPSAVDFAMQAFDAAAAREQPPSSNLMRRAEVALYTALDFRQLDRAGNLVQRALENGPVFPEEKLRQRFVRRVVPGQVAWLAFSGDTEAAEMLASKEESAADTFYAYWLRIGQSFAQRQNGHYTAAIATARKLEEACPQVRNINPDFCVAEARALRAVAQLDAGDQTAALASANEALEQQDIYALPPQAADFQILIGRVHLANGMAKEALEPLRQAYGLWLGHDPKSVWAAEAEYWFGQAWIANGDERGRWMVAEAKRTLATSKLKSHQALARGS
jgi:tetratricopeptide (TPR) repeat protein